MPSKHKALFLKDPDGTLTINCCAVYFPQNIISLRKTFKIYNGSNRHCVVHRSFYYYWIYADKGKSIKVDQIFAF